MPPKGQKEIVYPITSEEQFLQIISPENKKLAGTYFICLLSKLFSDRSSFELVRTMRCNEYKL